MGTLDALLSGVVDEPREDTRWLVLADWLEENDDPRRAELLRLHRRLIATCRDPDAHPDRPAQHARLVQLLAGGVRPCAPRRVLPLPGGGGLALSFIPPGSFLMGEVPSSARHNALHEVSVPRGFFMGIHPVTQAQWAAVMGTAPSFFPGANRPVERVTPAQCREFCTRLTAALGGAGEVALPTEEEWEYAGRAGTTTWYHFGDELTHEWANYGASLATYDPAHAPAPRETTPVGSYPPNGWGLYDVHGNVDELCAAGYVPVVNGAFPGDGPGPDGEGDPVRIPGADGSAVYRGGNWYDTAGECCSAARNGFYPESDTILGFRVCFRPA